MKKGVLAILLIFPFLIAFLAFATSDYLIKGVEQDIDDIILPYDSLQPFGLKDGAVKLEATPVYNEKYPLSNGNDISFKAVSEEQDIIRIEERTDGYYLVPLAEGQAEVIASNKKGNVSKRFTALVYGEDGAIVVTLDHPFSSAGIGRTYYWGTDDMAYDSIDSPYSKHQAKFTFSARVVGNDGMGINDFALEHSDNLRIDLNKSEVTVLGPGEAYFRFSHPFSTSTPPTEITFTAVEGVNVYSYADLIKATNLSAAGEPVVLHVNLDSKENYDKLPEASRKDVAVFGEIDGVVDPENYVYDFEATYNHDFASWWNNSSKTSYDIGITLHAGIRLRHSLYGNGFLINGHDLCYPSSFKTMEDGTIVPSFGVDGKDIFRGPLIYISAGNPYTPYGDSQISGVEPLLVVYGQDNSLIYADGDNITIDNLRLRNADFGNNYQNLSTAGTGIEILGDNVRVSNSVISSARTLVRSYSSLTEVDNCLLQKCLEFGIKTGANESNKVDYSKKITYSDAYGKQHETIVSNYLLPGDFSGSFKPENLKDGRADSVLTNGVFLNNQANVFVGDGLMHTYVPRDSMTFDQIIDQTEIIQEALTNENGYVDASGNKKYYNELLIRDCFFSDCYVAPVIIDSYCNGPFLEASISSMFKLILGMYMQDIPTGLARTMAPSLVTFEGDNRFYTYQKTTDLGFDSLIYDDIDTFINLHGGVPDIPANVGEDDYLPLRQMLSRSSSVYRVGEDDYIATPIMKMGGGTNLSDVVLDESLKSSLKIEALNCYRETLSRKAVMVPDNEFMDHHEAIYSTMVVALSRAASNIFGFEDYVFYCYDPEQAPYFGQTPSLSELSARS